jgi:hypothetical protein
LAFAPTRLSAEYLRSVYEILVPIAERGTRTAADAPVLDGSERGGVQQQQQQQQQQQRRRTR